MHVCIQYKNISDDVTMVYEINQIINSIIRLVLSNPIQYDNEQDKFTQTIILDSELKPTYLPTGV